MRFKFSPSANLKLSHKGLILVSVPLVFEIIFVVWLGYLLHQTEMEVQREVHAREIVSTTNQVIRNIIEGVIRIRTTGGRTWVLDPDSEESQHYQKNLNEIPVNLKRLRELLSDDPHRAEVVARAEYCANRILDMLHTFRRTQRTVGIASDSFDNAAGQLHSRMRFQLEPLGRELMQIIEEEKEIQAASPEKQKRMREQAKLLLLGCVLANILLAMWLAMFFNRGTARRLQVLVDNTRRLARQEPLNPPLAGTDEIAHLDRVFNEMAAALAAANRKERAIVQNAVDVICSIDDTGKFTALNPASLTLLGYEPGELIGTALMDIVESEDVGRTQRCLESVKGGGTTSFENRMRHKDGRVVDVLWSVHWSPDEDSYFCVAHNITERKEVERMKREFVAMVSHDLRTPLTSIQGFLSLASVGVYGELNDNGQENCVIAESNVSRLIALINDLLDIEKMESGRLELNIQPVAAYQVLERTYQAVAGFADQQGVHLEIESTDVELNADADRLVQVLVNLVSNAVKFSPEGSTVTLQAGESADHVEFRVIDQGRGIPAEFRQSIFERFKQVEAADAKKQRGTGLGLAICKAIVERHGGEIGVDSEEGKGSTFWFRLPRATALAGADQQDGVIALNELVSEPDPLLFRPYVL